jgi:flagellar hook-associated protein 1
LSFQHAYSAAARMVSAIDEALDTLINRTGLVGR